jgi:transcriptional regulator GlxA family with amidase domain
MSTMMNLASVGEIFPKGAFRDVASSIIALLRDATREVEKDHGAAKISIARASSLLQIEIAGSDAPEWDVGSGGLPPWKIRRLQAFVKDHLSQPIHVADLGDVAGLSVAHFSRAFRQSFRETPHTYVVRRRLERARHLMLTTDIALSELAIACGFSDQAHFCRLFRRDTGRTPAAWRRERTGRDHRLNLDRECHA